jgi:hypothetical protein
VSGATRAIALASALLAGCLPELVQHQGEHILFEHSAELEVCEGTVDYLDELIPFLSAQIGVATPRQIRYSWLTEADRDEFIPKGREGGTFIAAAGLAVGYHAMSFSEPALIHEFVHSLMGTEAAAPFFQEGLATTYDALVRGFRIYETEEPQPSDPRPMMGLGTKDFNDFEAANFVSFLVTRHGPERFIELYFRSTAAGGARQIRAAFNDIYEVDFDAEVELFMSGTRPCEDGYFELLAARCTAAVHPWQGEVWTFADVMSCDSPGVVGGTPNGQNFPAFRVTTLEIPSAGLYDISVDGDLFEFHLAPCFGCPWRSVDHPFITSGTYELEAGRYFVKVSGDAGKTSRFSVIVRASAQDGA